MSILRNINWAIVNSGVIRHVFFEKYELKWNFFCIFRKLQALNDYLLDGANKTLRTKE